MTPRPRCCHLDLSRVVNCPVLRCTASQDIKAKATSSLRHKGSFISRRGTSVRCGLAALHCATRSVHRVTQFSRN
jgi:hypothetical protein